MRAILIDWLVEVHMKFRLVPATLYLCVNIIDRYCSRTLVERRKLQLVGVTALLVACKYEEIYPPEVRDCVYITDRTYTRQEVLDMEQDIVRRLEFKFTVPTAYPFLTRFLLIAQASELTKMAANYYLERSLQEYQFLNYRPSLVAASAVCLALNNPDIRLEEGRGGPSPGIVSVSNRLFWPARSCFLTFFDASFPSSQVLCSLIPDSTSTKSRNVLQALPTRSEVMIRLPQTGDTLWQSSVNMTAESIITFQQSSKTLNWNISSTSDEMSSVHE